ncbi:MAG: hypothetical protein M0Q53_07455 [Prolixibacteraceae bacterium]|jgi:hypothetical protein|nr:hypothetical protein [Prolixibacteraceae bacterium]
MALDKEYLYLPKRFWKEHKQCELIVGQIEEFITNRAYDELRFQTINFNSAEDIKKGEHFLDFLLRKGRVDEHDKFVKKSIVNALLIDVCYFLQEALSCSKKKRLTVTFSLLRKPFVYHLPVFLRIMFDIDFLDKFNSLDSFDASFLNESEKILLLKQSLPLLLAAKTITERELYDWIFNQEEQDSLINLSNKALHLSTTRNRNNKTEIQNLNLVFSNQGDIENLWRYIYQRLPILLLYYVEIIEALIFNLIKLPNEIYMARINNRLNILTK